LEYDDAGMADPPFVTAQREMDESTRDVLFPLIARDPPIEEVRWAESYEEADEEGRSHQ